MKKILFLGAMFSAQLSYSAQPQQIIVQVQQPKKAHKKPTVGSIFRKTKQYVQENPIKVAIGSYLIINTILHGKDGIIGTTAIHCGHTSLCQSIEDTKYLSKLGFNGICSLSEDVLKAIKS